MTGKPQSNAPNPEPASGAAPYMRDPDVAAIHAIVMRQFASLTWTEGGAPDLDGFVRDFRPDAALFASVRPVRPQSPQTFAARMKALSGTALRAFREEVLGCQIRVFGNIAVAVVACENTQNGAEVNRNVEMMLFIKDGGTWKIAAQAWDQAEEGREIPPLLIDRR